MNHARLPLLIINPSTTHTDPTGVGIELIRSVWAGQARVVSPALRGDGPGPGTGYDFAAIVLMGSRASVHDNLDWERDLADWLQPVVNGCVPRPLLGICFGHQLIAHLAGGSVGFVKPDRTKLFGTDTSHVACRLLGPVDLRVVISHAEEVKQLPRGFHPCSQRQGVLFDGMEHETLPIFSFQFHPEAHAGFLRERGVEVSQQEEGCIHQDSVRLLGAFMSAARG